MSSHIVNEFDASVGFQPRVAQSYNHVKGNLPIKYEDIECVINGDYSVEGRKEGNEVYLPFSFIQNYFEVTIFDYADRIATCVHVYTAFFKNIIFFNERGIYLMFIAHIIKILTLLFNLRP